MSSVIDSHQHFWDVARWQYPWMDDPGCEPLRRSYLPEDLEPLVAEVGVDHTVFVQPQHDLEVNRWVLGLCEQHRWLAGVVGWVDLASQACEDQLAEFKGHPKFVGIRHITHDEPDVDWIVREDVIRGLKVLEKHNVPFDLLFRPEHLHHVKVLAERLPELPMVIDHLAKPLIKEQRADNWLDNFKAAAAYPNLYCKLSGMVTEADWQAWQPGDLKPYVQHALDAFGPDRLMFGSDWPVCTLAASYPQVFDSLNEALGPISQEERDKIFGGTAVNFYSLKLNT